MSRINLSVTLVEVVNSGFAAKATAALALTVCSITYGAGQVISGWLGDRFKPQNLISFGFLITACVNFSVGISNGGTALVLLWGINGFAQSLMWPPLVVLMNSNLSSDEYGRACVWVNWGASFGTIAVYLLSPVIIHTLNIRWVFLFSAAAAVGMLLLWNVSFGRFTATTAAKKQQITQDVPAAIPFDLRALIPMVFIFLSIILQGFLRDGVASWTPSYISDIFHLSSSVSILSGVILPVFSILSIKLASVLHNRFLRNDLLCAGIIFGLGCAAASLLAVFDGRNMLLSLLCLALLTGSMHGVNLILVCIVPPRFAKYGHVSLISGTLNAGTYVGSALSAYGTAVFSEAFGWRATILLWAAVALGGMLLCLALCKTWQQRFHETKP